MNIAACVLAAGRSRRMGSPKAWLDAGGQPFVVRLLDSLHAAGVTRRIVVAFSRDNAMQAVCDAHATELLVNPTPERGMLSSLHICLRTLLAADVSVPTVDALFVAPVDCPLVQPQTLSLLMDQFTATRAPIVVPRHGARRGHPTLFSAALFDELLQAPLDVGARSVVWAHAADRLEVPVEDPAVLDDVDTPEDWARLRPEP